MRITQEQYERIKNVFPVQRGNVRVSNITFLNAILYISESGCKWRQLPEEFGAWHTIYVRMQRWVDKEVWPRVQDVLKTELDIVLDITGLLRGSTGITTCPNGEEETTPNEPETTEHSFCFYNPYSCNTVQIE